MSIRPLVIQPLQNEGVQGSAREVIRIAHQHLMELRTQKELIHKRIHLLKKLVAGLDTLQAMRSSNSSSNEPAIYPFRRNIKSNLRRACLIALMEAKDAEDVEQLTDRIKTRGSYEFSSRTDPTELVSRQLRLMLSHGEVSRNPSERGCTWQLVNIAGAGKIGDAPELSTPANALPFQP